MRYGGNRRFPSRTGAWHRAWATTLLSTLLVVGVVVPPTAALRPEVPDEQIPAACLAPNAVLIDDGFLVSDDSRGPTRTTVDLTDRPIDPGRYQVTLHSFDFHEPTDGSQPNEQWRIELSVGGEAPLYRSDASADLPDADSSNATAVGPPAVLLVAADTLTAVHAFEGVPDDGTTDSLFAVCAVFDPLDEPRSLVVTKTVDADGDGTFAVAEDRVEGESGPAAFSVTVENLGRADVAVETLVDDRFGDLDGVGTCATPQVIGADSSYSCTFTADLAGQNAGTVHRNTVAAAPTTGEPVTASADVNFVDVAPSLVVTKTAVATVAAAGAVVDFTVAVENASSLTDVVSLQALVDDVYGSLLAPVGDQILASSCRPVDIAPRATYECGFSALVAGAVGDASTNTVTATATDDEANQVTGSAQHTITFSPGPPQPAVFLTDTELEDRPTVMGTYRYIVRFFNLADGPSPAATLTVALPNGITSNDSEVSAELPSEVGAAECALARSATGLEVLVAVGSVAAGESVSCSFGVRADLEVGQVVVAVVCLDETEVCDDEPTWIDGPPPTEVLGSSETAPPDVAPALAITGAETGHLLALASLLLVSGWLTTRHATRCGLIRSVTASDRPAGGG